MTEKVDCNKCIYCKSYCFDEYDADTWCTKDKPQFRIFESVVCEDYRLKEGDVE